MIYSRLSDIYQMLHFMYKLKMRLIIVLSLLLFIPKELNAQGGKYDNAILFNVYTLTSMRLPKIEMS